jgi:hypothetical protein
LFGSCIRSCTRMSSPHTPTARCRVRSAACWPEERPSRQTDEPAPHSVDKGGYEACEVAKSPEEFAEMSNPARRAEPSDVMGTRVREIRKRQGPTAGAQAQHCASSGLLHLIPNALYLIEGGGRGKSGKRSRRHVTVEELLGLSVALACRLSPCSCAKTRPTSSRSRPGYRRPPRTRSAGRPGHRRCPPTYCPRNSPRTNSRSTRLPAARVHAGS